MYLLGKTPSVPSATGFEGPDVCPLDCDGEDGSTKDGEEVSGEHRCVGL